MGDETSVHSRVSPAAARRRAKNMRRAQAKRAAARSAAARRRRRFLTWAAAGVVTMGLLFGTASACGLFDPEAVPPAEAAGPTPTATGPTSQLPPGANPALATKPTVTAGTGPAPTTLVVTPIFEGAGAAVRSGQTITVNYVGVRYGDGREFDSSWRTGQPASFSIGVGAVIAGWDQGLVGQKIGSRVQLDIPTALAYPNPQGGQPEGPLRFVVDILGAA